MTTRTKLTAAIVAICFIVSAVLLNGQSTYVTGATGTFITNAATRLRMTATNLLGRTSSGSGPIQEIAIGSGLVMTNQTLAATGGGGGGTTINATDGVIPVRADATTFTNSGIAIADGYLRILDASGTTNVTMIQQYQQLRLGPSAAGRDPVVDNWARIFSLVDLDAGEFDNNLIRLRSIDTSGAGNTAFLDISGQSGSPYTRINNQNNGQSIDVQMRGYGDPTGDSEFIYSIYDGTNVFNVLWAGQMLLQSPMGTTNLFVHRSSGYTGGGTKTLADDGTYKTAILSGTSAGGSLVGTYPNPTLASTGVTNGVYGSATMIPQFSVGTNGLITGATNVAFTAGTTINSSNGYLPARQDATTFTNSYVSSSGTNTVLDSSTALTWNGATKLYGTTNGYLLLTDTAGTAFTGIQLGGTTASYPMIKRNGGGIDFRTASDSAYSAIAVSTVTLQGSVPIASDSATLGGTSISGVQIFNDGVSPTASVIKGADATGSDGNGAAFSVAGGGSRGAGRGGDLMLATSLTSGTGSTVNSFSTRGYFSAKPVDLTDAGTNTIFTLRVDTNTIAGLVLDLTVYANDGTNYQSQTMTRSVDAVNKAGTLSMGVGTGYGTNATVASSGTLGFSVLAEASGSTNVLVRVSADSSLTTTTFKCKWAVSSLNADGVATVTPQ